MKIDETPRQRKIAAVLQRELSLMLQEDLRKKGANNIVISITKVSVTVDLSLAKIYISIFPKTETEKYLNSIQENVFQITYIYKMAVLLSRITDFLSQKYLFKKN